MNVAIKVFFSTTTGGTNHALGYDNRYFDTITGATGSVGYKKLTGHLTMATTAFWTSVSFQTGLTYRF